MRLPPWAIALLTLVVVTSLLPTTIVAAQEVVTLTVTIETPDGEPVANAALTATWDGGSSTATTVSNGKAFIDVEQGADVEIAVERVCDGFPEFGRAGVGGVVRLARAGGLGGGLDDVFGRVEVRFPDLEADEVAVGGLREVEHHANLRALAGANALRGRGHTRT